MSTEPDVTSSTIRWESLQEAFRAYRFPTENLAFAQRVMDEAEIDHYEAPPSQTRYLKAIRKNGGPALRIESGFTSGFTSEQEATTVAKAAGDVQPARSSDGVWSIPHPYNAIGKWYGASGNKADPRQSREGTCAACGYWKAVGSFCDVAERPHARDDLSQ